MLHVKKEEKKEVQQPEKKIVKPVEEKKVAPKVEKKVKPEPEKEEKYNGLHAYEVVYFTNKEHTQGAVQQRAYVVARTEESAKNRVESEYSMWKIVRLTRIKDEEGHKIISKVKKAGVFPVNA